MLEPLIRAEITIWMYFTGPPEARLICLKRLKIEISKRLARIFHGPR